MLCKGGIGVLMIYFGSLHQSSISITVSHGDAAGQDALNHAAVEVAEDLRWHTYLSMHRKYSCYQSC